MKDKMFQYYLEKFGQSKLIEDTGLITSEKADELWNKYLPDVEYVVHGFSSGRLFGNYKDKSSFSIENCGNKTTDHPNEKPIGLIQRLLVCGSEVESLIIDPFLGSGTTAVACERLNRKWIGIEIEEKYCEIAAQRIENERKQRKLF